jgi:ribonucleotide monophosphatase NagD (HAD superfamily)
MTLTGGHRDLLGLYQSIPLTRRRTHYPGVLPDRDHLLPPGDLRDLLSESEVAGQVRKAHIDEVAHHFGISDERLDELGWRRGRQACVPRARLPVVGHLTLDGAFPASDDELRTGRHRRGPGRAGPRPASDLSPVDVVLIGGAGPEFSYQALNQAFRHLQRGARLVAMHRGLYWRTSGGLQLDTGAFLAGLEQAAATDAEVVGKPAAAFFAAALAHLGADAAHTLMTGDDIETDVLAAQRHGLTGVLVKTGKYLPRTHHHASGTPNHVLDSFADLPALERLA